MAVENGAVVGLSNHVQKAESTLENVRKRYAMFINNKPITVFAMTTVLLGALTALGFHLASAPDFSDPKAGFETRGTILSDRVLTWTNLEERISFYPDSRKEFYRQLPPNIIQRSKRAETNKTDKPSSGQHLEEIFFTALTSSPCLQLNAPLAQLRRRQLNNDNGFRLVFSVDQQDCIIALSDLLSQTYAAVVGS